MPNKTIYVSDNDLTLFDEAKNIAGEAVSSVISRALREYVSRHRKKAQGMKEVSVLVGNANAELEKRFVGAKIGTWTGFSDDREWWLESTIYRTQKNNWAVHLVTVCKASLLTNKKVWKLSGDYLTNPRHAELLVGSNEKDFGDKIPQDLLITVKNLMEKDETPVEFLDI